MHSAMPATTVRVASTIHDAQLSMSCSFPISAGEDRAVVEDVKRIKGGDMEKNKGGVQNGLVFKEVHTLALSLRLPRPEMRCG